jgi:hypothetical protein
MTTDKRMWHFLCFAEFNKKIFKETITSSDIISEGKEIFLSEVTEVRANNTTIPIPVNRRFVKAKKGNKLYLIPREYATRDMSIYPGERIHCYLKESDGIIYRLIKKPEILQITPENTIPFRIFIDEVWNPMEHSSQKDWTFLKLLSFATSAKGVKIKVCSPPATGKNSNFTIGRYIHNNIVKISKPSQAKLYYTLYFNQTILPDELTSLTSQQIAEVEGTFCQIADESPELEKNTMSQKYDMNTADIANTSVVFTFQRRCDIKQGKFFDDIWKNPAAMEDRYPAIMLEGKITETMPKLSRIEAFKIMEENYQALRIIAKNRLYYTKNLASMKKDYSNDGLQLKRRHRINFEGFLDVLSAYCESQVEYSEWIDWINQRVKNYKEQENSNFDNRNNDAKEEQVN